MATRLLLVALGGALGSCLRYAANLFTHRAGTPPFPYATFFVNVTGCFLIGLLAVACDERAWLGPNARVFLLVGVLGGYTTFSSFGYETVTLASQGATAAAFANVAGQVVLGLAAVWAGMALGRAL